MLSASQKPLPQSGEPCVSISAEPRKIRLLINFTAFVTNIIPSRVPGMDNFAVNVNQG